MSKKSDNDFITDAFAKLSPIEPSASLSRKVASIPLHHPRQGVEAWWPFAGFFKPALGLFAAGLLGFLSGGWVPEISPNELALVSDAPAVVSGNEQSTSDGEDDLEGLFALAIDSSFVDDQWDLDVDETSPLEDEVVQ